MATYVWEEMKQGVAREGADCQCHQELKELVVKHFLHHWNHSHTQQAHQTYHSHS